MTLPTFPSPHTDHGPAKSPYRLRPRLWMLVPAIVVLLIVETGAALLAVPFVQSLPILYPLTLIAADLLLVVPALWYFGWLRPIVFESRVRDVRLALLAVLPIPLFLIFECLTSSDFQWTYAFFMLLLGMKAGIHEELMFRGAGLFLARTRLTEIWVLTVTSGIFGVIHLSNLVSHPELPVTATLFQVLYATLIGMTFYAVRRVTGTILVPMVLHSLFNFTSDFTEDATPVVMQIGFDVTLSQVIMLALVAIGATAAVLLAVRYPRVPVLPSFTRGTAPIAR